jgi:ActR/RegA family two-component response regulator
MLHQLDAADPNESAKHEEHDRKEKQMIQAQVATLACQLPEIGDGEGGSTDVTFPCRTRPRSGKLSCPKGLVASSDEEVMRKLAKIIGQCGLATLLAVRVSESIRILDREKVCLVLCYDYLIDGSYEGILKAAERSRAKAPVIVFSSTGDWPDYFRAIRAGAFDYMAYPPFLGDLPRVIRNALASTTASTVRGITTKNSNSSGGEMP